MIYLIEDSDLKARQIADFLARALGGKAELEVFGSYQTGLSAVKRRPPGLIILDMTLPNFDRSPGRREGKQRTLGGYEIMRKMRLYEITSLVVIVTQLEEFGEGDELVSFGDISARISAEFPSLYLGSVYYDQAEMAWEKKLGKILMTAMERNQ